MSEQNIDKLLERLNKVNKDIEVSNQQAVQNRGFKKAQIEQIQVLAKQLNELGVVVKFDVDEDGRISQESIDEFKKLFVAEYKAKLEEVAKVEAILEAVEKKDYETIRKLTGEDIKVDGYNLEITGVKELIAKENEEISALKDKLRDGDGIVEKAVSASEGVVVGSPTNEVEEDSVVEDSLVVDAVTVVDEAPVVEVNTKTESKATPVVEESSTDFVEDDSVDFGDLDGVSFAWGSDEDEVEEVETPVAAPKKEEVVEEQTSFDFSWNADEVEESPALEGLEMVDSFFDGMVPNK